MVEIIEGPEKAALERIKKRREGFCGDLKKIVPKLKKEIEEKNTISISPKDLIGKMGLISRLKYIPRHPTGIYWDSKYCLWNEGIYNEISEDKDVLNDKKHYDLKISWCKSDVTDKIKDLIEGCTVPHDTPEAKDIIAKGGHVLQVS